ncbi:MAG: hypothetical protein ACRER5_16325 [Pseudomonas sp.]
MSAVADIPLIMLGQVSHQPFDLSTYSGAVEYLREAMAAHLPGQAPAAVRNTHPAFDPADQLSGRIVTVRACSPSLLTRVRLGDPDLTAFQAHDAFVATTAISAPIPQALCAELIYSHDGVARAHRLSDSIHVNCGARLSPEDIRSLRPGAMIDIFLPTEATCPRRRVDPLQRDILLIVVEESISEIRQSLEQALAA